MVANPQCLFTVTHTFMLPNHGIALMPGIAPKGEERFRVGDFVELRRPDRSILQVKITGIEMLSPVPADRSFPIVIKEIKRKDDVPIGTEVWSI